MASKALRARMGVYSRNFDALHALHIAGLAIAATLNPEDEIQKRHLIQIMFLHGASKRAPATAAQAYALAANWYLALKRWRALFNHLHWGSKVDDLLRRFEWLEMKVIDDTITQD